MAIEIFFIFVITLSMSHNNSITRLQSIQTKIYEFRGHRVMLDFDLAFLFEVESSVLNMTVMLNRNLFPEDFMMELDSHECESIKHLLNSSNQNASSQIVMMNNLPFNNTGNYLSCAFTAKGLIMLSSILQSFKAICMNIAIKRASIDVKRLKQIDLKNQMPKIKASLGNHDVQLNQLYEALENMLDEKAAIRNWEERERIGFKIGRLD